MKLIYLAIITTKNSSEQNQKHINESKTVEACDTHRTTDRSWVKRFESGAIFRQSRLLTSLAANQTIFPLTSLQYIFWLIRTNRKPNKLQGSPISLFWWISLYRYQFKTHTGFHTNDLILIFFVTTQPR